MADLNLSADTGLTVTAQLFNNATAVGLPIACTAIGTTGEYFANVPGGTAAGKYLAVFFAGTTKLASGVIEWDGTKEVILGDVPTAAENATAVRTELAVELARIDAAVSTRSTLTAEDIPEGLTAAEVWAAETRTLTESAGLTTVQAAQLALVVDLPTLAEIEGSTVLAKAEDLTDLPSAADTATAVLGATVEAGATVAQSLRLANAVLGGKVSGGQTGTETFRNLADTKNVVVSTNDAAGNRTAVTKDLS